MADMLASLVDLATLLGKTEEDPLDNSSGTLALEVATAVVQNAAGQRILLVEDDAITVWGGAGQTLVLPERPIVSVASVTYNGTLLAQGTDWRMGPDGLWRRCGWTEDPCEPSQVDVVCSHGYAADRQEIQLGRGATLSVARGVMTNPDGTIREQIDDYAVAFAEAEAALDLMPGMSDRLRRQYGRKAGMVRVI